MKLITLEHWDHELWQQAEPIYREAFPQGRKSDLIIQRLVEQRLGLLQLGVEGAEVLAMAVSAPLVPLHALLIDYLAVSTDHRKKGLGGKFFELIRSWSLHQGMKGILIEAESDPSEENQARLRFWSKSGFTITDYVHQYIWVPEPYRAMYVELQPNSGLPRDGEGLFRHITEFHRKAWSLGRR